MSTTFHLAKPADLDRLLALSAACHAELGLERTEEQRIAGLAPLLEGLPQGAVYLFGPARAPLGHMVLSFGWALAWPGMEARIEEFFIRPPVRGRGIATEVLFALPRALGQAGVAAMHVELPPEAEDLRRLFSRGRFQPTGAERLTRRL